MIDTDLANVHMNLTELGVWKDDEDLMAIDTLGDRKGSVGGLRGGVGLEMKDWLARSNPSVSLFVCLFVLFGDLLSSISREKDWKRC